MLGVRNKILLNPTTLNNSGIQIHGGLIPHFLVTIVDGVQGVHVMFAHSIRFVPITLVGYPVFVRNEEIHAGLVDNSSFYNKVVQNLLKFKKETNRMTSNTC
jgi:hypothetical protein